MLSRCRSPVIPALLAVIALVLLPAISNVEANALPASWSPFLWIAWPAGLVLAAPLVYLEFRQRHHDRLLAASVDQRQLGRAATDLAAMVRRQWTAEVALRTGGAASPLPVRWSIRPRPGAPAEVEDRQLVILGEPGAGKTMLALLFVLDLLNHRQPDDPVPVVLTMSSWNPADEDLRTWLGRRIVEEYPVLGNEVVYGLGAVTALVDAGRVVAVLDGLDEMPASAQPAAVNAINRAAAENPVMVTCRTKEYDATIGGDAFFRRAVVLDVHPVDLADAGQFLAAAASDGPQRWQPVLGKLGNGSDAPLAKVLASPLMIALASTVYAAPATGPDELLDFTEQDQIEQHLFDAFIQVAYQDTPPTPDTRPSPRYPRQRALDWLTFLARHSRRLNTDDLAWWHLLYAMPRLAMALSAAVSIGLLFGLAGVLAAGLIEGANFAFIFGLATAVATFFGRPRPPTRVQLRFHGTAVTFLSRFAVGTAVGLGVALAVGIPVLPAVGSGLVFGLTFAPRVWLDVPTDTAEVSSPGVAIRQNRTAALAFGLTLAVALGFITGAYVMLGPQISSATQNTNLLRLLTKGLGLAVVGGFAGYVGYGRVGALAFGIPGLIQFGVIASLLIFDGPVVRQMNAMIAHASVVQPTLGVWYGITLGFAVGVTGVLSRAWGSFCLARSWLALRGHLPWRLMRFLDDAHRRGVLRQSGAVYQFRHATLRDHLADGP